jgi:hypothetical protein
LEKIDPKFPSPRDKVHLATELSSLLRQSYGERSSTIKRIAVDMAISERTVKNWYRGRNGPRADHLIYLMGKNEKVFMMVLAMINRPPAAALDEVTSACSYLARAQACLMRVRTSLR